MKWIIMVLIMVMCILLIMCYAMLSHMEQDERTKKMARKWAEEHSERVNEIVDNLKADVISADKLLIKESEDE